MKRLLILLLLVACSHEHKHEHVIHGVIDDLNTAYIVDVDPPVSGDGRIKYGYLVGDDYLEKDYIKVTFSQEPHCLTVNDYPYPPDRPVIPLEGWALSHKNLYLHAPDRPAPRQTRRHVGRR